MRIDKIINIHRLNGSFTDSQMIFIRKNLQKIFNYYSSQKEECLEILKWLYQLGIETSNKININIKNDSAFRYAAQYGHMETAVWLYQLNTKININAENDEAFRLSCKNNHMEMVKWLYQLSDETNIKINVNAENCYSFRYACFNGDLEKAKWLYELGEITNNKININIKDDFAFKYACINGHLTVAKWLYQLSNLINIKINITNNDIFKYVCFRGHLEIAKWLYYLSDNIGMKININNNNNDAFRAACYNCHLEVAKWLYQLGNETNMEIDLNTCGDEVFTSAYCYNSLEMAKWLYQLGISTNKKINTKILNNAFISTCQFDRIEIAEWLCIINSNYTIIKEGSRLIPHIKNFITDLQTLFNNSSDQHLKENLDQIYKNAEIYNYVKTENDNEHLCPLCLSNEEIYRIQLPCNAKHIVCIRCFCSAYANNNVCHYKCKKLIDVDDIKLIKFMIII